MKVIKHLDKTKEPLISFEIIPPKRGGDFKKLDNLIENLTKFKPPFIDLTSHAASITEMRKRPGTLGICAVIHTS